MYSCRTASPVARLPVTASICVLLLVAVHGAMAQTTGAQILQNGKNAYQNAQYVESLGHFRDLLIDPAHVSLRGDAYFWISKTLVALSRFDDAERNLEFFLANYLSNENYSEALYQRGRLLFLQAEYDAAVETLAAFVNDYPQSAFVANAFYWMGESLLAEGLLTEAEELFRTVVRDFPTSFRVEAAQYRITVIELQKREVELIKLLRWSHEDNIRNLDEFRRRETTYEEAIAGYQSRINALTNGDISTELDVLRNELSRAQQTIAELTETAQSVETQQDDARATAELEARIRALDARQAQLENQGDLLRLLVRALRLKESLLPVAAANQPPTPTEE